MITFSGELKERQQRKFIVSKMSCESKCHATDEESKSSDYGSFCDCVTQRTSEMGLSSHKIYSIKTASGAKSLISPKELAETWNIGLETARKTLKVTTCLVPRNVHDITLNRRYTANDQMIRYWHIQTSIYMDTMYASKRAGKSFRGYTCEQVTKILIE